MEKFPVRWTAPEAMAYNKYSIKSDVWSFGILVAETVTYGKKPYFGLSNKDVVSKIDKGYRMEKPQGCPDGIYKIMLDCWKTEPMDRPTFESLVYRLEDFFHSGEANYTDPAKFVDESEKPDELPPLEKEELRLRQPSEDKGGDDSDEGGGGDGGAAP
jgi:fyn-related kinase